MDSGVILVSFCEFILNVTLFGGVWFCCCKVLRQWTLLRAHVFLFVFFWDIFPSMCERKRKQHKTFAAQAGEMCENEHARNYEWHYGRLGAECYKLKVYKRENYKALLWENCIFSSVTPAVPLESPLLASIYCLNWELPPCRGYLATCKLNSFEYPSSSFFYLPSCCCFFLFFFCYKYFLSQRDPWCYLKEEILHIRSWKLPTGSKDHMIRVVCVLLKASCVPNWVQQWIPCHIWCFREIQRKKTPKTEKTTFRN